MNKAELVDYKDNITYFFIPGEKKISDNNIGEPEQCYNGYIYGIKLDWNELVRKFKELKNDTNR